MSLFRLQASLGSVVAVDQTVLRRSRKAAKGMCSAPVRRSGRAPMYAQKK